MAKSLKVHDPKALLAVCVVEEEMPIEAKGVSIFDKVVLAKDLGYRNFHRHIFKHNAVEGCTSMKARLLKYLLEHYPNEEKFVYIDGDTKIYGKFDEVDQLLNEHSIMITPHILYPEKTQRNVKHKEIFLSKFGIYNLGFIAIRRSENALNFLNWWGNRLIMFCYIDIQNYVFTDQKWIDYAPAFFDTYVLKHPGYNVAWWNLTNRKITKSNDGKLIVNGHPLRFFHYSGILRVKGDYTALFELYVPGRHDVAHQMITEYVQELIAIGQDFNKTIPWSYDHFKNGEAISEESRRIFRQFPKRYENMKNPFQASNGHFILRRKK